MQLNPDCVRDILLTVEESTDLNKPFRYGKAGPVPSRLSAYSHNELVYHFRQCNAAGLFAVFVGDDFCNVVKITDLSPGGHDFLNKVRDSGVWARFKPLVVKAGASTIGAILRVLESALTDFLLNT